MNSSKIYRCNLTVHLIQKSHNGQRIISSQTKQVPIIGHRGANYQISYLSYLPNNFHLAPQSTKFISGQIVLNHGQPSLSSNTDTFTYEANVGLINITYLDLKGHRIAQNAIKGDIGEQINDITTKIKLPYGYHYVRGIRNFTIRPEEQFSTIYASKTSVNTYQFAVRIIQRDDRHDPNPRESVIPKDVWGQVGHHYTFNYRNFKPEGYQLDQESPQNISGVITRNGLVPASGSFMFNRAQSHSTRIKYINQNDHLVGSSLVKNVNYQDIRQAIQQIQIPTGYYYDNHQASWQTNHEGTEITIRVQGRPATKQQSTVHLLVNKKDPSGQLISQTPTTIHVTGRVGDTFKIQAKSRRPDGFLNSGTSTARGVITPQGAKVNHRTFTYVLANNHNPQHSQVQPANDLIIVKYFKHGRLISKTTVHGKIGRRIDLLDYAPLPQDCFLLSGQIPFVRVKPQLQVIKLKVDDRSKLFKTAPQATSNLATSNSTRTSSAAQAPQSHRAASASDSQHPKEHGQSVRTNTSSVAKPVHSQTASTSNSSSLNSSSATASHPVHVNLVRKGFLDGYYNQLFDNQDYQPSNHSHRYQLGIRIANQYIKGIEDARRDRPQKSQEKNYRYGYRTFRQIFKKQIQSGAPVVSQSTALLSILKPVLNRLIPQNRSYYVQQLLKSNNK